MRRARLSAACAAILLLAACGDTPAPPSTPSAAEAAARDLRRARNLARLHFERDSEEGFAAAVDRLRKVVASPAADFDDRLNFGRALLAANATAEADAALAALERSMPPESRPPALDYAAGIARKRLGDNAGARERFERLVEKLPRHRHASLQLGRVCYLLGDLGAADAAFAQALAVDPRLRAAAYHRMLIAERTRRPPEEVAAARAAFAAIPEAGQPDGERCDLLTVTLRRARRADADLPEPAATFVDATGSFVRGAPPADVRDAVAVGAGGLREDLWLLLPGGVRLGTGSEAKQVPVPARRDATRLAVGDVDNDALLDAVVGGDGGFTAIFDVAGPSPTFVAVAAPGGTLDLLLVDLDHDGDLDVVRVRDDGPGAAAAAFHRHDGERSFATATEPFPPLRRADGPRCFADFHDLDQGNDVDLVFPGAAGPRPALNRRDGSFAAEFELPEGLRRPCVAARAEDMDGDGAPDLVVAGSDGFATAINADGFGEPGVFRVGSVATTAVAGGVADLSLEDVDRDGDRDYVVASSRGVALLLNRAAGPPRLLAEADVGPVARVVAADLDGDGAAEFAAVRTDGSLAVLRADVRPRYAAWVVRPSGRQDNRGAVGTVVEQSAGPLYASAMIKGPSGIRFGLGPGGRAAIDGVRLRFPQGVVQPVVDSDARPDAAGVLAFVQKEGLVASCPFLYARGPRGVAFLTDVVGIAPLDEWLPPGVAPALDPEEDVRIADDALAVDDGKVVLHVTEELRETTYLDRVALTALEHPRDVEVHADESTRQGAFDPLTVFVRRRGAARAPASVVLPDGSEASTAVAEIDGIYAAGHPVPRSQWAGWVGRYEIEITVAAPASALALTGRIAWYDSTTSYAIHQSGRAFGPLRLDRVDDDGRTETLVADLGLPAGMDRTMVVPLPAPLPAGARVRLSCAHRFLWDRIAFVDEVERVVLPDGANEARLRDGRLLRRRDAPLVAATLGHHGFSAVRGDRARHLQTYDFAAAQPDDAFRRATGLATRYGDVLPLLRSPDDRFVVLVAGDRATLEFAAPRRPSDADRTWFLRVTGFAKESGFHNRTGRTIAPLPFRGMTRYPPPAGESPDDRGVEAAHAEFLTRVVR